MLIKNIISQRYKGTQKQKWEKFIQNFRELYDTYYNK